MRCTVCLHAQRADIDRALVAGEPERSIASRHGVTRAAVNRHRTHMSDSLAAVPVASTTPSPEPEALLGYLRRIVQDAERIARAAEEAEEYIGACAALREQTRVIGILMRVAEARVEADRERAAREPLTDGELEELAAEVGAELERRRKAAA